MKSPPPQKNGGKKNAPTRTLTSTVTSITTKPLKKVQSHANYARNLLLLAVSPCTTFLFASWKERNYLLNGSKFASSLDDRKLKNKQQFYWVQSGWVWQLNGLFIDFLIMEERGRGKQTSLWPRYAQWVIDSESNQKSRANTWSTREKAEKARKQAILGARQQRGKTASRKKWARCSKNFLNVVLPWLMTFLLATASNTCVDKTA